MLGVPVAVWGAVVWLWLAPRLVPLGPVLASCGFFAAMLIVPAVVFLAAAEWAIVRPLDAKAAAILRWAEGASSAGAEESA